MPLSQILLTAPNGLRIERLERSGFRSFKTAAPMHYPSRWHRDLLIQATLDPAIEAIEPGPAGRCDAYAFRIFVLVAGVRRLLIAVRDMDDASERNAVADGFPIPRSYILSEPRCSAARTVWSARTTPVPAGDRLRVLRLFDDGATDVTLSTAADAVSGRSVDPTEAVLALVCAGQLEIDLRQPLSPETLLRRRGRAASAMQPSSCIEPAAWSAA